MQNRSQAVPCIDQRYSVTLLPTEKRLEHFPRSAVTLGILQLTCGCLCIIFNSVGIVIESHLAIIAHSIWCGTLFVIAGVFGIGAGLTKTTFHIVSFMVFSIISASLCPAVLVFAAVGVSEDEYCRRKDSDTGDWVDCDKGLHRAVLAMNAMLIVLAVVEATIAIISAVICSRAYCCYKSKTVDPWQDTGIAYAGIGATGGAIALNPEYIRMQAPLSEGVAFESSKGDKPPSYEKCFEHLQSSVTPL